MGESMGFLKRLFGGGEKYSAPAAPLPPLPYPKRTLSDHLSPAGRKRVLALDGGGVRGVMAIAVLERIEALLRERHANHPEFRLCDYYDLIGGTSTGSIIAAALAGKRFSASEIKDFYFDMAPGVFKGSFFRKGLWHAIFDGKRLLKRLEEVFGDMTLGSEEIATGFALIAKRVDTNSVWVLHNHPDAMYFNDPPDGSYLGNRHYPIANIVRGSTAAPHYFQPERIEIIKGREYGLFVDGGITPHNNPCFQLLMLAGLRNYNYGWTLSEDDLIMHSIGTGSMAIRMHEKEIRQKMQIARTLEALTSMISGNEDFIELLMQWVGDSPDPKVIDSEIGDLRDDYLTSQPLLSIQRYQSVLGQRELERDFGMKLSEKDIATVRNMTDPAGMSLAYEIGQAMAETLVKDIHFPERFDLTAADAPAHPAEVEEPEMETAPMLRARDGSKDGGKLAHILGRLER